MKIPLPNILKQEKDNCMETSLSMLLNFWGVKKTPAELNELTIKNLNGISYLTGAAYIATSLGLKTDCYGYDLEITTPTQSSLPNYMLVDSLKKINLNSEYQAYASLVSLTNYLSLDTSNYFIEKPNIQKYLSYLDKNIPLLVTINSNALYSNQGSQTEGHSIIVNGYENNKISIIDPAFGDEREVSLDDFWFAVNQRKITAIPAYMIAIYK